MADERSGDKPRIELIAFLKDQGELWGRTTYNGEMLHAAAAALSAIASREAIIEGCITYLSGSTFKDNEMATVESCMALLRRFKNAAPQDSRGERESLARADGPAVAAPTVVGEQQSIPASGEPVISPTSEIKPDGSREESSREVDRAGGGNEALARGAAVRPSGVECGSRASSAGAGEVAHQGTASPAAPNAIEQPVAWRWKRKASKTWHYESKPWTDLDDGEEQEPLYVKPSHIGRREPTGYDFGSRAHYKIEQQREQQIQYAIEASISMLRDLARRVPDVLKAADIEAFVMNELNPALAYARNPTLAYAQSAVSHVKKHIEQDAARYRFLVDCDPDMGYPHVVIHRQDDWGRWRNDVISGVTLDEAVDKAIAASRSAIQERKDA